MNKESYLKKKQEFKVSQKKYKTKCRTCWQPDNTCICKFTKTFHPNIHFVILTHPIEASKRIASGRIAHACLNQSYFYRGYEFIHKKEINQIILSDQNQCFVLYPSLKATDLTNSSPSLLKSTFDKSKKIFIFVIDGTWGNANKMLRLSPNVATLPKVRFTPRKPSQFKVRQQPKSFCVSTLEAINEIIQLLEPVTEINYNINDNPLINAFNFLVDDQVNKMNKYKEINGGLNYRSPKKRV